MPQGLPGLTLAWIDSLAMGLQYAWEWLVSGGAVSLEQVMAPDRPFALLARRQLPVVVVNALIVAGLFHLARRLLGQKAAWLGVIFVILDPFFLAESRVMRFEGLVAGLMPLALLAVLLYFKESRLQTLVWSAVFTALAMLTKISAVVLVPLTGLFGAAVVFGRMRPLSRLQAARWAGRYLLWVGLVAFFFWLLWPAMWVSPVDTLKEVWSFVETAGEEGLEGRGVFFWGQVYPDDPGPWFYPVALLFRLTPLVLAGVIIALVGLARTVRARRLNRPGPAWRWWSVAALLVYSLLFVVIMTFGAKKYDRYLMPVFPALDLVAGAGWMWLYGVVQAHTRSPLRGIRYAFGLFVLLVGGLQALTTLPHLPYYYTYYNPLLGGTRQAVNYIRVGFAEGLDQVAAYLNTKPNAADLTLASANSGKLKDIFAGHTMSLDNLNGKWVQADYALLYVSQLQRQKHAEDIVAYLQRHPPEYTLQLHGLDYAWLYPAPAAQFYGGGHKLEGRGTLFGYNLSATELPAGESLEVTLFWRNEGQRKDDRFFVRLMDLDGYVWAEAIAQPKPGFEAANRTENAIVESLARLVLPVGMPPGRYFLKPGFRTTTGELIGYFELPGNAPPVSVTLARRFPPPGEFEPPHTAHLAANNDLLLQGFNLTADSLLPGEAVWVTLYWQAVTGVTHDYVVLLRLLDEEQQELAYWLGRPVRSGYPTLQWQAGQVVQDPWLLTIPAEAAPGMYRLEIALFDAATEAETGRQLLTKITVN